MWRLPRPDAFVKRVKSDAAVSRPVAKAQTAVALIPPAAAALRHRSRPLPPFCSVVVDPEIGPLKVVLLGTAGSDVAARALVVAAVEVVLTPGELLHETSGADGHSGGGGFAGGESFSSSSSSSERIGEPHALYRGSVREAALPVAGERAGGGMAA
eukprot:CAMPEP_0202768180 /NCGR_PEP_ID=MMETSP1388-20130828/34185_1 /ASSEMBLY_ACC=CAM_ASM_000864 /TAXON_ID=37098 /ORGANISM="Isochrysis sp, Strain CCMP1244" /LENGTH=155 /DNA_ID=CAMNT_0049436905 /DNA_START=240 /DNA_END=709 /DNA_ORIENTATION=-